MTLRLASNVNGAIIHEAPEGFTDAQWHQTATADTGTSHVRTGRIYLVQCEWCRESFGALTAAEAMRMFRDHEERMLRPNPHEPERAVGGL